MARAREHGNGETSVHTTSDRWALAIFLLAELVALVIFMTLARRAWFTADEWEFLAGRTAFNLGDLFRPHYDHWVTLPVLAFRGLWWTFGLRSYVPYQLAIVLLHLTAALLVRITMRRIGVRPWTATAVASVLVFFGTDAKSVILPFQITIVGSLVFGFAQLLFVIRTTPTKRYDAWGLAAGCAALMCSGIGVAMVIAVGVAVLIARNWRSALVQTVPLGLVYLTWYFAIGHRRERDFGGYELRLSTIAGFVGHLTSWSFDAMGQVFGVGALLALLLVVGLALAWAPLDRGELRQQTAVPIGLLVGAAAFMCITAIGRSDLGSLRDFGDRYLSVVVALVLPAIGVAADAVMHRWRAATPVAIALLLVGIPGNVGALARTTRASAGHDRRLHALMLSLPHEAVAAHVPRDLVPDPDGFTYLVTIGWLRAGGASGRIPEPRHVTPEQHTMDTLRLSFRQKVGGPQPGDACAELERPLRLHLGTGDRIVVGAANHAAAIVPIMSSVRGTLPFTTISQFGATYVATRPVWFQIKPLGSGRKLVCARRASFSAGTPTFPVQG